MKEDIWEEGYIDTKPYGTEYAMPKGWERHFSNNGHWKLGPVREFYDARTPQELIYKYAAAAAQDLYRIGANARTGNPEWAQAEKRKRTGHLFWKFNDTWPRYYCSFYDYYQECTLPYYTVKRVFKPLFLHLAVKDHPYLWGGGKRYGRRRKRNRYNQGISYAGKPGGSGNYFPGGLQERAG